MQSLSPMDGSAAAVRQAAAATDLDDPTRRAIERELDRVNAATIGQLSAFAQHITGLLLVQAVLLAAYLGVLIGSWNMPLPGKRWLLVGVAVAAAVSLIAAHLGLRAQLGRMGALRRSLRAAEEALERIVGRTPVLARSGFIAGVGRACVGALPWLLIAGWVALALYALALPPVAEQRLVSDTKAETRAAASEARPAAAQRPARTVAKADEAAPPAPVEGATAPDNESPLASFLRRAASATATPSADTGERVTP